MEESFDATSKGFTHLFAGIYHAERNEGWKAKKSDPNLPSFARKVGFLAGKDSAVYCGTVFEKPHKIVTSEFSDITGAADHLSRHRAV